MDPGDPPFIVALLKAGPSRRGEQGERVNVVGDRQLESPAAPRGLSPPALGHDLRLAIWEKQGARQRFVVVRAAEEAAARKGDGSLKHKAQALWEELGLL